MSELTQTLLIPDWPAPASVRACVTTRRGGISLPPYDTLNLGDHVGDDPVAVAENRRRLSCEFAIQPAWLKQVHGLVVADADPTAVAEADASWTHQPGIACTVMTADCLPALFCDRAGTRVAAAHAGWRGLAGGVLEATLQRLALAPEEVLVCWARLSARKRSKWGWKCAMLSPPCTPKQRVPSSRARGLAS